ncbi:branched-chain amino acid aminotransferase [Fimbriiglobus ruber]|uniref:Branched-chain-amino-acid aminotransferase n=1 Tax=Fimbriiglobus ruber TaxID=1908690 RepID=A0A225D5M5_9BACT|nr:branched-chain amino acid aminotransferase [Fimbriiglobus ruber]OWK36273.1 Branched-chain amino acid aminotransferase [Fimbriiglobus ruber]
MSLVPLDDRDGVIWLNGKLVPWRDAKLHVLSHSLHYGNAVFEGARIYGGKVFKLTEHTERLHTSGRLLNMEIPYSVAVLEEATKAVVAGNDLTDGYVRPIAWRGAEVLGVSAAGTKVQVAIAVWPWPAYYADKAIKLKTSRWKRPSPESAPTASKCAGLYVLCTLARDEAIAAGYQDAFMLDYRGQVAEATGANLFFVMDGELHTPTADCFLNGLTRQTVIGLAKARGLKVIERAIWPNELPKAQEVFITGTAVEVTAVSAIDDHAYEVGPITKSLQAEYAKLVRA